MISPEATKKTYQEYYRNGEYLTCSYTAFEGCETCKGSGRVSERALGSGSIYVQCIPCLKKNEAWKRTHPVYYRLQRFPWYEFIDRYIDKTTGKVVEKKKKHQPKETTVYGYAVINGETELLILDYVDDWRKWTLEKQFKNIEAAQSWIAAQHNGNIAGFWNGL